MATTGKSRLKKLLSKGLTGWEAGRLIIQESIDREQGIAGFTQSEIQTIIDSLQDPVDIEDYNNLREAAISADYSLQKGLVLGLLAKGMLTDAQVYLVSSILFLQGGWDIEELNKHPIYRVLNRDAKEDSLISRAAWLINESKQKISEYFAIATVLTDFYSLIEVRPCIQLRMSKGELDYTIAITNLMIYLINDLLDTLARAGASIPSWAKGSKLDAIDANKIKPDARTIKKIRSRLAADLGEGWWRNIRTAPGAREEASPDE